MISDQTRAELSRSDQIRSGINNIERSDQTRLDDVRSDQIRSLWGLWGCGGEELVIFEGGAYGKRHWRLQANFKSNQIDR